MKVLQAKVLQVVSETGKYIYIQLNLMYDTVDRF